MAKTISSVVIATDTFASLISKTNQVITALGSEIITANTSVDGANTTGNTNLIGIFGANTVAVGNALRGGTVNAAANLTISSNAVFSGSNTALTSNVIITNSVTSVNAISLYLTGPTLSISSNTTASGNLAVTGAQLSVSSNAVYTGSNTTIQSTNFNVTSNTSTVSGNNFSFTGSNVAFSSNTSFTGLVNATANVNITGDILRGTKSRQTVASNTDLGGTTGSAIDVASWPLTWGAGDVTARVGNTTSTRASKILVVANGTDAYITEYAVLNAPTTANLGVYSITTSGSDVVLRFTPTVANLSINLNVTLTD
jgi:hypothetical protein